MSRDFSGLIFRLDPQVLKAIKTNQKASFGAIRADKDESNPSIPHNEGCSQPKSSEKITIEKAVKEILKERVSSEGLIHKLNFLELLENVFFTDYEKKLVPHVLLKQKIQNKKHQKAQNLAQPQLPELTRTKQQEGSLNLGYSSEINKKEGSCSLTPIQERGEKFQNEGNTPDLQGYANPSLPTHLKGAKTGVVKEKFKNKLQNKNTILEEYEAAFKILKRYHHRQTSKKSIRGSIQSYIVESLDSLFSSQRN